VRLVGGRSPTGRGAAVGMRELTALRYPFP
jgi:hypothetical protein